MTNYGMLVCSFYLKKRFSRGTEKLSLLNKEIIVEENDKKRKFSDIFGLISSFCESNRDFSDNKKSKKMFSVEEDSIKICNHSTYRTMSLIIRSGSYGIEGYMTNRHTMEVSHHRTEDEAEVKKFHCLVYVPKDIGEVKVNKGILVFQSISTYGVKTITIDAIRHFLSKTEFTIETRSVSVRAFLEKLINQGALNKVTLIRNNISPNPDDNMLINTGREERAYIKPILKPDWIQKILEIFQKFDETHIIEIPENEDFDDISIQFKLGDKNRTVRLKYLERLSIVEDIPEGIVSKEDDLRLIDYMIETASAYKDKMVFGI